MPYDFEHAPLWQRTLAPHADDSHTIPRQALRAAYLQFRATVEPLADEIARSMPMFTDHSIAHIDALWDTASLVCGSAFPLNAAEAFVLGGAFLLHDLGMGLASYQGGLDDIEADPRFRDLLASATERLRRADPFAGMQAINAAAREQTIADLLRLRHAEQAEQLVATRFQASDGDSFYLLESTVLRQTFGSLIGQIARSHWQDVAELRSLERPQGSCVDHPAEWEVDPLKIACILRLADAAHIDHRRAPAYLHAFRRPVGISRDHWYFQERLTRPRVAGDRLEYTATRPFSRDDSPAWWLAWDTVQAINSELRTVDALCADLGRPRFQVRSVAGADSPERLALYIRTDRWKPVDARFRVSRATDLIANLGGEDLYGKRPEVAIRELVANAADATRARSVHEGSPPGAVTVRLSRDDGSWWLTVEDNGIGMAPETMVAALTDFGHSRWNSPGMISDFPGLLSKGFDPIGRFGIGFFAVFMIADEVAVRSLAYDEAPRSTHVLEFRNGIASRPLLREADLHERLRSCGTTVRARLRHDPRSLDGLFKSTTRSLTTTELLHTRLTRMCALVDVDIKVCGPDDQYPVRIVQGGDWTRIPPAELFRRLYPRQEASHLDRVILDGYEKLFIENATDLHDSAGTIIGRAMMVSGFEMVHPDLRWMRPPEAMIYVRGLRADKIDYSMGAFCGRPLTADRLKAFPVASIERFQSWVEEQAEIICDNPMFTHFDREYIGMLARGFGAIVPRLSCAQNVSGTVDRDGLAEWIAARDEILLVSAATIGWITRDSLPPFFFTYDGREVMPTDECIFVDLNPPWFYPEEVLPRPRDERFADVIEPAAAWDPRTWWYDTGNFGTPGLVVRTIAETWDIGVVETVNIMEPLYIQGDHDLRAGLPTSNGDRVKVTAIRMRRPLA